MIKLLKEHAIIGYHVSYRAHNLKEEQCTELNALKQICGTPIRYSRNHYLASKEPDDFNMLISNGITDDFTMGYAEQIGFRLGTCKPVHWIDPRTKEVTSLVLHPLSVMECTLDRESYMNLKDEDEAFNKVKDMLDVIRKYNGDVVLLWHNQSFSEDNSYYKTLYIRILNYITSFYKR